MTLLICATVACLTPLVLFLIGAARVRGWKNEAGRAVMGLAGAGVISFAFALARQLGYLPSPWVRSIAYGIVACALWWLYITFLHVQRDGQRRDRRRLEREELQQNR